MNENRVCQACGRPLPKYKKKWCGRKDCGGWESVHYPVKLVCKKCGIVFERPKGYERDLCDTCFYEDATVCETIVESIIHIDFEELMESTKNE